MDLDILRRVIAHYPAKIWLIGYVSDVIYKEYRDVKRYVHGRLIDIGCGTKPYKDFFASVATQHIGVDHSGTLHSHDEIDIFASAYAIPEPDASFDSAICNTVLEHLEEPEQALRECYRLLKPGGIALYTVPFIWHLHEEPRDFFRYSKYGLRYLFEKAGFQILEIRAHSGFWVTFGQLLVYNLYRFNRGPLRWCRVIVLLGVLLQVIAYLLDRLDKTEEWTWLYSVVAKKPERAWNSEGRSSVIDPRTIAAHDG
jgi:SAM-dependent methyltransferase